MAHPVAGMEREQCRWGVWTSVIFAPQRQSRHYQRHYEVEWTHFPKWTSFEAVRLEGDFGGDFVRRNRSRPTAPPKGLTVPEVWSIE